MGTATPFVSVSELLARIGSRDWPIVIDARREPAFAADPEMLPGAIRCAPEEVDQLASRSAEGAGIVSYCTHGDEVSQGLTAELRRKGCDARYLEAGIERWRAVGAPLLRKSTRLGVPGPRRSLWVTRERPKIDRIACPWLIRRFIDPRADFRYVPTSEVLSCAEREGGIAFDIPGGAIEHDGPLCSFDTLLREFGLQDDSLGRLAVIVRGADTDRLDLAPQAPGLLAVSLGLSKIFGNDNEMLDAGMVVYDALYAWCRFAQGETHGWNPAAMR